MIDHPGNRARYPDPPAPPAMWWGWRRKKGAVAPLEHVLGADAATKGQCYQKLMELSELVGTTESVQWEFVIAPAGERPKAPAYSHRMLRPQG